MFHDHQTLLQVIQRFDVRARRAPRREDVLLDGLEFLFQPIEKGKVSVHDGVHERVQHVAGSLPQQLRFPLAACPHFLKTFLRMAADREHVVGTGEYRHLTHAEFALHRLDHVEHDEKGIAVFLHLGTLMPSLRVLDRQRMQPELPLQQLELGRCGIVHRDPHECSGAAQVLVDLVRRDFREFLAVLVDGAIDEHGARVSEALGRCDPAPA